MPPNVFFLDNDSVYLTVSNAVHISKPLTGEKYIKIIGSTLWSDIDVSITRYINDYNNIYTHQKRQNCKQSM